MTQGMAIAPSRTHPASEPDDLPTLPTLIGRLGDQVSELVDTKIDLLKIEVKEEVNTYLHGSVIVAAGGVMAAVGFSLVNVAAALGASLLFARYGMASTASYVAGFVTTGLFYLVVGSIVVMVMKNRLAQHNPAPTRTIDELRKDKQWLTKEL
jgi:uncharacterized membrane protein YqjE